MSFYNHFKVPLALPIKAWNQLIAAFYLRSCYSSYSISFCSLRIKLYFSLFFSHNFMALYWIVSCQLENVIWRTDRQLTSISNFLGTLLGGWDYVGVEYVLFSFTYSLINVADGISIWILESVFYPELFQRKFGGFCNEDRIRCGFFSNFGCLKPPLHC